MNRSRIAVKHGLTDKVHVNLQEPPKPLKQHDVKEGSSGMGEILAARQTQTKARTSSPTQTESAPATPGERNYDPYSAESIERRHKLINSINAEKSPEMTDFWDSLDALLELKYPEIHR